MQPVFKRASPWLLGMLLSTPVWAVSVGDMRALSALGEPLRMELELVDLEGTRASDIKLVAASAADYARLGLIAPVGNDALGVSLTTVNGHVLAQLTSAQIQNDPHVSLLLQISWPGALRLQQVAAVLLPPAAKPAADAPVAPTLAVADAVPAAAPAGAEAPIGAALVTDARVAEAPVDRKAEPAATSVSSPLQDVAPLAPAAVSTVPTAGKRVVVVAGDSLGSLAAAWNAPRLHVAQRQQLIAETNPQIFTGGNINRLRVGAALTLPSADTEPVPSLDESVTWLKAHEDGQLLARPTAVAASTAPVAAAAGDAEITLTLVSPTAAGKGSGTPAAAGESGGLSDEMAAAESTRDDLESERAALQTRLDALKTQTEAQDARLKLLDERLAALNSPHKEAAASTEQKGAGIGNWLGIGFALVVLVFWMLRRSALQAEAEQADIAAASASASAQDRIEFEAAEARAAMPVAGLQPGGSSADEYDFMTDSEAESFQTRLDLAQAYLDMGETQAAHELLRVVQQGGTAAQRQRAGELLGTPG